MRLQLWDNGLRAVGFIGIGLLWVFLGCSKAPLPNEPAAVQTVLQVTAIDPTGAALDSVKVYLDGAFQGWTPYRNENMRPGLRSLRLMKTGYEVFTKQLVIEEGQTYSVEAVLMPVPPDAGQLVVTTDRDSVTVTVRDANDQVVAESTERVSTWSLPPGAYVVTGSYPGLEPVVKAVEVVAGQSSAVHLEFEPVIPPLTLEFSVEEDTVEVGQPITLRWESNGYQVIIDQGVGPRGPNGSEKVVCHAPGLKVYTATAYAEDNSTLARSDTVYVKAREVSPPNLEFSAEPDTLVFGEPVRLEWSSDGYQVVIDQGVGARGPVGSEELYFDNPGKRVFTATAYGEDNLVTIRRDSIYIKEAPLPELPVVLLATTRRVQVNTPATITWVTHNADYVVVDFVPNAAPQGTAEVTFSTPGVRIVTATAYNQAGYVSATDTIEVVDGTAEAVDKIVLSAQSSVRADKGEAGYADLSAASFNVSKAGRYRVYAKVWYNSGDAQLNESFYLELRKGNGDVFYPVNPNAGRHKVVPDDPGTPHTKMRRAGVFRLSPGTYDIDVYHYAKIAAQYPQFLNGSIAGPESVKILGFKIVYLD